MSQNSAVSGDLRVRRTQKFLQDAFVALVIEVGFEAVTVQMIANRAMVNRATFYRHYQDKYDLAEQVYRTLTAAYQAQIADLAVTDPLQGWELLFAHIAEHGEFYQALLAGAPHFRHFICHNIEEELLAGMAQMGYKPDRAALPTALALRYLATAQMGIIQWWLEKNQPLSQQEMAQHLWQLHSQGAMHALGLPSVRPDVLPPK